MPAKHQDKGILYSEDHLEWNISVFFLLFLQFRLYRIEQKTEAIKIEKEMLN